MCATIFGLQIRRIEGDLKMQAYRHTRSDNNYTIHSSMRCHLRSRNCAARRNTLAHAGDISDGARFVSPSTVITIPLERHSGCRSDTLGPCIPLVADGASSRHTTAPVGLRGRAPQSKPELAADRRERLAFSSCGLQSAHLCSGRHYYQTRSGVGVGHPPR